MYIFAEGPRRTDGRARLIEVCSDQSESGETYSAMPTIEIRSEQSCEPMS
jgi:hypothetical protein